jgi:hypothetical protein
MWFWVIALTRWWITLSSQSIGRMVPRSVTLISELPLPRNAWQAMTVNSTGERAFLFHNIYKMVGSAMILVESRDTKLFHMKGLFLLNVDLRAAAPMHCVASRDRELNWRKGLLFRKIYNMVGGILVESRDTKLFHTKGPFLRNVDLGAAAPTHCVASRDRELNWSRNPSLASRDRELNWSRNPSLDITLFTMAATTIAV